jgi:regulator of protease activity HflC (stomatin/prohibitin superfamily)
MRSLLRPRRIALFAAIGLLLPVLWGAWFTVDEGDRGVVLRNGRIIDTVEAGFHVKWPVIESVKTISVRTQTFTYETVASYSRDQQTAELNVAVTVRLDPSAVAKVYADYGSLDGYMTRIVHPRVYEHTKTVFGRFNAIAAVQERGRLNAEVEDSIREAITGTGGIVESVQIQNIDFSDQYERSIEARMQAEVEVQKLEQQKRQDEVNAERRVITAKAEADAMRAQADGQAYARLAAAKAEADAIRMRGEAEAASINARGEALRDNPDLVHLITAERWNGALPTHQIPGAAVPFIRAD